MAINDPARTLIRRARPDEAHTLTELALRSKAHWGYDAPFMAECRRVMTLTPAYFDRHPVYTLESGGRALGIYALTDRHDGSAEIDLLFVEPDAIGMGYGAQLWRHAVATAHSLGFRQLLVESDPNAEGFYRRMGMTRIAEHESNVQAGRMLPILHLTLDPE